MFSVGCNTERDAQMSKIRQRLAVLFPEIRLTDVVVSAAYGRSEEAEPYANMLAECDTAFTQSEIVTCFKTLEREMGDSVGLRAEGCVMMDLDLLEYNGVKCHADDWQRPYIKTLLRMLTKVLFIVIMLHGSSVVMAQTSSGSRGADTELLGKAIEYYNGAKYHECVLAFEKLSKSYRLSSRFMAYLGYSYYKEQKYAEAADCLRKAIPDLSVYSPRERSVYYYSCAESLFHLGNYNEALEYYNLSLPLTEGNDKADVLFHTAFAHYFQNGISTAVENVDTALLYNDSTMLRNIYELFGEALALYRDNSNSATSLQLARRRQCQFMLKGFDDLKLYYLRKSNTILP